MDIAIHGPERISRKKKIIILVIILTLILVPIINNYIFIRMRIYYEIDYDIEGSGEDELIKKVERFKYDKYLMFFNMSEEGCILGDPTLPYGLYICEEYIAELKETVKKSRETFHLYPLYSNIFKYTFRATKESRIYLEHNNDYIIKVKNEEKEVFLQDEEEFNFLLTYINFTIVPKTNQSKETFMLSDIVVARLKLGHHVSRLDSSLDSSCGTFCIYTKKIYQWVGLTPELQVVFIGLAVFSE